MNVDSNESVYKKQLKTPFTISNKSQTTKLFIKNKLFDTFSGYIYQGFVKQLDKKIYLKFISKNGYHMVNEIASLLKIWSKDMDDSRDSLDCPNLQNEFTISIFAADFCLKNESYFLALNTNYKNVLSFAKNWKGLYYWKPFYYDCMPIIRFLHKKGIILNNLRTSSIWCIPNPKMCKKTKPYRKLSLADHEFWCRYQTDKDNCKIKPEILEISKKRLENPPEDYIYCAVGRHKGENGCMKFDYESLFYIYLELLNGHLPWEKFSENEDLIRQEKEKMRSPHYNKFDLLDVRLYKMLWIIDKINSNGIPNTSQLYDKFEIVFRFNFEEDLPNPEDDDSYFTMKARESQFINPESESKYFTMWKRKQDLLNKKGRSHLTLYPQMKAKLHDRYEDEKISDPFEQYIVKSISKTTNIECERDICKSHKKTQISVLPKRDEPKKLQKNSCNLFRNLFRKK